MPLEVWHTVELPLERLCHLTRSLTLDESPLYFTPCLHQMLSTLPFPSVNCQLCPFFQQVFFFNCRSTLRVLTLCHFDILQIISLSSLSFNFDDIMNKLIWGDVSSCFLTSLLGPIQKQGLNVHSGHLLCPSAKSYTFLHRGFIHCLLGSQGSFPKSFLQLHIHRIHCLFGLIPYIFIFKYTYVCTHIYTSILFQLNCSFLEQKL